MPEAQDEADLLKEFDRQVGHLTQTHYAEAAGIHADELIKHIQPLKQKVLALHAGNIDLQRGYLPFVVVTQGSLLSVERAMSLVERYGKHGVTKMYPHRPTDFATIDGVRIPSTPAYLLLDINRGKDTINMPPHDALAMIRSQARSPLTIDEGVAIVTHYPEFLIRNNCFSLLASRHSGDKRVPAIWIDGEQQPNLGWCWAGNPHTWLGSASCADRIGVSQ